MKNRFLTLLMIALSAGCGRIVPSSQLEELPEIYPDYREVTIPANIAPLNFSLTGEEPCRLDVRTDAGEWRIKGDNGLFRFPRKAWKEMTAAERIQFTVMICRDGEWMSFKPFFIYVAPETIDSRLSYRLIPPGYQGWKDMGLYQRNLETFDEKPILENRLTDGNCLNCHSYCNRSPEKMLFHSREVHGGTLVIQNGKTEKLNTKTDSTISPLVYPYWHPSGKYVAFSVNSTLQSFFNHNPNRIEVFDKASDVVVYDVASRKVSWSPLTKSPEKFETFPAFSPDGKWLYFCSAEAVENMPADYDKVKYALVRVAFNPEDGSFGDRVETVFDAPAMNKSVSFPRISPDGRWLAFTLHGYGNFSIWHKDADIWMLDLRSGEARNAEVLNSNEVESYHCWSGNGRWLVFSSRRDDGLFTRPYIAYVDSNGTARKPFMLPQKNPKEHYHKLMFAYNIPELMTEEVKVSPHTLASVLRNSPGTDVRF